jgi:Gas vesicle protein
MTSTIEPTYRRSSGLVDVLDRVLDKGLVIAGDIRVSLAEVELLTIRIRLLVCSIDKAEQIGLDWWRNDPNLSVAARRLSQENESLREQIRLLEERVSSLAVAQEKPQEDRPEQRKPIQSDKQKKTRGKINAG